MDVAVVPPLRPATAQLGQNELAPSVSGPFLYCIFMFVLVCEARFLSCLPAAPQIVSLRGLFAGLVAHI